MRSNLSILSGICPNCQKRLFFAEHEASVECTGCGQRHTQGKLRNLERVPEQMSGVFEAIETLLQKLKQSESEQKPNIDQVSLKVNGLSNYLCAILSPLLTDYGMDKTTGRAKLLTEMGKGQIFDCAQLGDRAFLIEPEHLSMPGYGQDRSGSYDYLRDTLNLIKLDNENEERLVPIHADGDGHCLVHAVSRALVGWQLFWHPLRVNLMRHFQENFTKYQMQFQDFIDASEWQLIIKECDPNFVPNGAEPTGLRNIHILGLANVLKRPIILLDSLEGIQSSGDYSAIFLPCFSPPSECMNKDGILNNPICIAWSSPGRNHFIPLVGVKGKKCPVLSRHVIQRAWGISDLEIDKYVHFDDNGFCQIGGEKVLQAGYFQRLVSAMSDIFYEKHHVSSALLADVYQQIFKANGLVFGMDLEFLLEKTKASIEEGLLFICLSCHSLGFASVISEDWCYPGGELYELAKTHGKLKDQQQYSFPLHDVIASYDACLDKLVVVKGSHKPSSCLYCSSKTFRLVDADYTVHYENKDKTMTKSKTCQCGFKHYWEGKEYDGFPKFLTVQMDWGDRSIKAQVDWFQDQEDPSLNSNAYEIAQNLVQAHFPGEFGSERLVQKVVEQILRQTNKPEAEKSAQREVRGAAGTSASNESASVDEEEQAGWSPHKATKAILTGLQRQSVHKEELNKSTAERRIQQQIEANASKQQRKLSDQMSHEGRHTSEQWSRKTPERKLHQSQSPPPSPPAASVRQSPPPLSSTVTYSQAPSSAAAAGATSSTTPTGSGGASELSTPTNKRIRLSTSDGRNITLDLPSECTFLELQSLITDAVNVPSAKQKIRYGFPPRELKPPATPEGDYKVPIQPGDKIMLDILHPLALDKPAAKTTKPAEKKIIHPQPPSKEMSWTSFAEGGMDEVSDRVLQGLMDPLLASGGDNLDHSLSALALTAALDNKDLWLYVQLRPHLFSVNGLFYKQVERDVGLEHGKHCQLPLLPHKVFVYNRFDDRLELCLEPYGHFPIEINVERNASGITPASTCNNKSTGKPFSGQGHSLRPSTSQEERMPTDVPMSPKRHEARRLNTLCDPALHQESIEEEDEETDVETVVDDSHSASHRLNPAQLIRNLPLIRGALGPHSLLPISDTKLVRKGPGYSELSPIPENAANESVDMLHQLVSRIERVVESLGQDMAAAGDCDEPSPHLAALNSCQSHFTGARSPSPSLTIPALRTNKTTTENKALHPTSFRTPLSNNTDFDSRSHMAFPSAHYSPMQSQRQDSGPTILETLDSSECKSHSPTSEPCPDGGSIFNIKASEPFHPSPSPQDDSCVVAALAGQVAFSIAAMDTDVEPEGQGCNGLLQVEISQSEPEVVPESEGEVLEDEIMEADCEHPVPEAVVRQPPLMEVDKEGVASSVEATVERYGEETELGDLYIEEKVSDDGIRAIPPGDSNSTENMEST